MTYFFVALANKKLLLPSYCRLDTNLFPDCVKLIGYFASAVNVVPSNPCVGLLPRHLFPDICTDVLTSAPKIIAFFSMLPSDNENSERESNILTLYLNLSRSAFLVRLTDPNKQLLNVKYVFKFFN